MDGRWYLLMLALVGWLSWSALDDARVKREACEKRGGFMLEGKCLRRSLLVP